MMTPTISSPTNSFPAPSTTTTTTTTKSSAPKLFPDDLFGDQDENLFQLQNLHPHNTWTTPPQRSRETARKTFETPGTTPTSRQSPTSGVAGLSSSGGRQDLVPSAGWTSQVEGTPSQFLKVHKSKIVEPASNSSTPRNSLSMSMREPVAVSNIGEQRHALTPRNNDTNAHIVSESRDIEQSRLVSDLMQPAPSDNESAMTPRGRRSRVPTADSGVVQDSIKSSTGTASTPPRHSSKHVQPAMGLESRSNDESVQLRRTSSFRSSNPNAIPRNPRDTAPGTSSPQLRGRQSLPSQPQQYPLMRDNQSVQSQTSGSVPLPSSSSDWQWGKRSDPDDQEQALFEQRLCEDAYGVAVRKINQNGKSNLRYVKCFYDSVELEVDVTGASSTRSVSSRSRGAFSRLRSDRERSVERSEPREFDAHRNLINKGKRIRVLTWGKKKDVKLPLDRFVCVRKGKSTERTRRNISPASRILSLITDDPQHPSLDIEAPTRIDRDKFARAFARFLDVPLEGEDIRSVRSADVTTFTSRDGKVPLADKMSSQQRLSAAHSVPEMNKRAEPQSNFPSKQAAPLPVVTTALSMEGVSRHLQIEVSENPMDGSALPPSNKAKVAEHASMASIVKLKQASELDSSSNIMNIPDPQIASLPSSNGDSSVKNAQLSGKRGSTERAKGSPDGDQSPEKDHEIDEGTVVSSLTGAGFDQEIVEELHQALTELRAELEESRAEAARAVKVAEQAIQSAENSSSKDWNSTVTHKAAEAAALAQKKSAEAMAKQRLAEERLDGERRNAAFWRKQAEVAEEEAGALQTRAAAAEVQRAAMAEALESEKRKASSLVGSLRQRFSSSESNKREALEASMERNWALELEVETLRRKLDERENSATSVEEGFEDGNTTETGRSSGLKKIGIMGRKAKKDGTAFKSLLPVMSTSSSHPSREIRETRTTESLPAQDLLKLHAEVSSVRKQFEILRKATANDLSSLPKDAEFWANQTSQAILASESEVHRLRAKLAWESATRRKLLHEVQDLRGAVRVYCRPRASKGTPVISISSHEVLLLHRELAGQEGSSYPLSFEFDGIFDSDMGQDDVYNELEEVCLGVLDGYNVCVMAYGQTGSGKTRTLLGDVAYSTTPDNIADTTTISNYGIHLQAARQIFSVAHHRKERYQDVVTFTIVEVHNERLCDLIAGTDIGESRGKVTMDDSKSNRKSSRNKRNESGQEEGSASSKPSKLEIKTNHNGDTIVHGLLSVEVSSLNDVIQIWDECLRKRYARLSEQGSDLSQHESSSHVIATLKVASTNISTGIGSTGKIQFVDLAGSDVVSRRGVSVPRKGTTPETTFAGVGNNKEWKFVNRSLNTLTEVVNARSQFMRSVPYRNSTLTHLLSDSLEADTKVVLVACVSSDLSDLQETACTLRFASKMRKIIVGKATKHTLTHA